MKTGKEKLIEQFLADDIHYMFGNPGTVEQEFLDVISKYKEFHYITCLHESVAVGIADGYSRKTKKPALVQLHSGVGLGNGIGMMYQAYRGHSPLIVIAGEAGIQYGAMDAQMACNLVDMAKPVTKYAERVTHKDSLLRLVRRAVKIATTPPEGPVFLSLPMDVLDEENEEEVIPSVFIDTKSYPERSVMEKVSDALLKAEKPLFLIGDGVNSGDAVKELDETAGIICAEVYGVNSSCINFDMSSPLYKGDLGHMFGEYSTDKVKDADVVLIMGTYVFPEVFPSLTSPFKKDAVVIHIDLDSYEIAKNHTVSYGIEAHPKAALSMLNKILQDNRTDEQAKIAKQRFEKALAEKEGPLEDNTIISEFMKSLKEKAEGELVIFDEALTASPYLTSFFQQKNDGTFFQTRGGSLGVGIPGAIGIKLASPEDEVITFTGDGGSMYTIQALYTAVRYDIPIKIVICNNGSYKLLENNIQQYWKSKYIQIHSYPDCFQLKPSVDFVKIAQSMGVDAVRVNTEDDIESAVDMMVKSKKSFLIDLNTK